MKHIKSWFPLYLVFFGLAVILQGAWAVYPVTASAARQTANLVESEPSETGSILVEAHKLVNQSGSRPFWPLESFRKGENVPGDLAPDVVAHLIACESQCVSVKHLDSNHAFSYGDGQVQSSTWQFFEKKSGLSGDPMSPTSTVPMMLWAVENGYLWKWSCAKILGIVQ